MMTTKQDHKSEIVRTLSKLSVKDLFFIGSTIVGIVAFLLIQVGRIDRLEILMADTRSSLGRIELELGAIKRDIATIKSDIVIMKSDIDELRAGLDQTRELLQSDLAWRYLYSDNPAWKNHTPRYDPVRQKLEIVPILP